LTTSDDTASDEAAGDAGSNDTKEVGRRVLVEDLFHGRKQVILVHNGEDYCLRITSNDRLILTK